MAERELANLSQQKQKLNPLTPVGHKTWDLLIAELPGPLLADAPLFSKIREMVHTTAEVNEAIRSRESFRLLYPSLEPEVDQERLDRYNKLLGGYDHLISQKGDRLSRLMEDLEPDLRALAASSARKRLDEHLAGRQKEALESKATTGIEPV